MVYHVWPRSLIPLLPQPSSPLHHCLCSAMNTCPKPSSTQTSKKPTLRHKSPLKGDGGSCSLFWLPPATALLKSSPLSLLFTLFQSGVKSHELCLGLGEVLLTPQKQRCRRGSFCWLSHASNSCFQALLLHQLVLDKAASSIVSI